MIRPKLLIVGAFPSENHVIYGGILKSCQIILDSSIKEDFKVIPLNSSQISNPPPGIMVKCFFAIKRLAVLLIKLTYHRPDAALIFASDGASAIEKGLMVQICSIFNCKTLLFPRAGNLITQTSNSRIMLKLIRLLFRRATIFLCQGNKWKDYAILELGFEDDNVKVVNNWTATKKLLHIGSNKKYNNSNVVPNILFIGWLEDFKGVFELLEAVKKIDDQKLDFNLTFAGEGSAKKRAKDFVEKHNLTRNITFAGWVDDSGLEELLRVNDIFVLPSWAEGLPNSMIEAMAAGLAVIVTSVGSITDFVINKEHGLIIKPKDIKSLEGALRLLISDQRLRNQLSVNGHNMAKEEFSSEISINNLTKVIKEIVHKK